MTESQTPGLLAHPAASTPLVDMVVMAPLGRRRLVVDQRGVTWGGERVLLESVEAVAYGATRTMVEGQSGTLYTFSLWTERRRTTVVLNAARAGTRLARATYDEAFTRLADVSARLVEPRLQRRLLEQVAAGKAVTVAGLHISERGLGHSGRLGRTRWLGWDRFAGAGFHQGAVSVNEVHGAGRKQVFSVSMAEPNAVLLPELLQQCARRG